ncbi:MAG: hypothetical protein PF795_15930 [Kiritimatiellae bacterium]|jgi:hypothetical protein|nr:hypothetical protein [Kiritimatiellia bacterium]
MSIQKRVFYSVVLGFLWPGHFGGLYAQELWRDSRAPLSELVELRNEKETLPESRWVGRDQRKVDREMDKIKDRLLQVLERSELTRQRDAYHAIVDQQESLRLELRDLRERRISAPDQKSTHQVFTKTREDYADDISEIEDHLRELDRQREERVKDMQAEYAEMGIELKEDQVQFYLSSVSGDDIMAMSSLFHHTREINQQLEDLIKANPEDIDSSRRYYGVHVVLLETMQHAHEKMVEKIDHQYLGALSELEQENDRLIEETENLLSRSTVNEQDLLLRNRQLQELTGRTLVAYRHHLDQVRAQVSDRLDQLRRRHEIAANSYATLRVSSALASQIAQLMKELNTLQGMHLPELLPFENEVLEEKFKAITKELEGAR